jgi:type I restriction enzyme M protein
MTRERLNTQFWKASKILRQDDNTNSLLDYVEQISWLLFLKCFEEDEARRKAEAEYRGQAYRPTLAGKYQWSSWTNPEKRLTGRDLLAFLNNEMFPYLRELKGNSAAHVIRSLFAEAPSKMLKDGAILRDAIDVINEINFESADDVHTLSHLYESMLSKLGREGGMGGEFYTPRPIIEFVVKMVEPGVGETVYDPAMGSAGFLVEAYKHVRAGLGDRILTKDEAKLQNETFFGQEKKPLPYLLGCMNMVLHGVFSSNLVRKNTLADDVRKFTEKDRFNVILTNPPFGGTEHASVTANFRYPSKSTSITFLQHIMAKVKRGGRVGMVIDEGVLFKTTEGSYVQAKKELIEQFNLHTIVSLPTGSFANAVSSGTGPKTNLLFFNRDVDSIGNPVGTKDIWYYEVEAVGFTLTKTQRPISENDLPDCLAKAKTRVLSDRSWIVPVEEIVRRNYDLSAMNPNAATAIKHRSPSAIAADIAGKQARILEIMEEIQETLEATADVEEEEANEIEVGV